jgi:Zn2+/Cd2+-exporting ATPase
MKVSPQIALAAGCGGLTLISLVPSANWVVYGAIFLGGIEAIPAAWHTLRKRSLDIEFLMLLAAVGSVALGKPLEAAILLFLFSLSKGLESYTLAKTKGAIDGLVRLRPDTAIRLRDGHQETIPVEQIVLKDQIVLPPFMTAPVDGIVMSGTGSLDQSALTGESVPVSVSAGSKVMAGVRNLEFALTITATSTTQDSTLQKIVNLVAESQNNQGSGEKVSRWFGERYTWFVLLASVSMFLVRCFFIHDELKSAAYASLTLLVALSPCALVISVPAATLSALTWAARNGILIRGGEMVERAGQIDTIAYDKTGTLTLGRLELVEICLCQHNEIADVCWSGDHEMSPEAKEVLRFSVAAEANSEHPVGRAIIEAGEKFDVPLMQASRLEAIPGIGIHATVNGTEVMIGQPSILKNLPPSEFQAHIEAIQSNGWTVAVVDIGGKLAAMGFADQPKPAAKETIQKFTQVGILNQWMLTGDNQRTAQKVASMIGVTQVMAGLLPAEKVDQVKRLNQNGKVMMIGDGINDAPALTEAYLGVAMGGLGSDIALNAADIVLMNDKIEMLPDIIQLGKKTNRIIRANLILGSSVIGILTILSMLNKLPLPLAVIGHEGSTLLVILNGLLLLRGPNK